MGEVRKRRSAGVAVGGSLAILLGMLAATGLSAATAGAHGATSTSAPTSVTLYVDPTGTTTSCLYPYGSACPTLADALQQATGGSYRDDNVTVSVAAGTYKEKEATNASTLNSLTISGAGAAATTVASGSSSIGLKLTGSGTVSVTDLSISGNARGINVTGSGNLTVSNSKLDDDGAPAGSGGAIYADGTGKVSLVDDTFDSDAASGSDATGGAVDSSRELLTVNGDTFTSDSASGDGGAILVNGGSLKATDDTFATDGAGSGDGVVSSNTTSTITNDTFFDVSSGGALVNNNGTMSLIDDTFDNGGAVGLNDQGSGLTVSNSILEDTGCAGPIGDGGYNVESDDSCGFGSTDVVDSSTIELASSLGAYGSSGAQTLAISPRSSAFEVVPPNACGSTSSDERGQARPGIDTQSDCDAGAFEYQAAITSADSITFATGKPSSFTATTRGDATLTVTEYGGLPPGTSFASSASGTGVIDGTPAPGSGGTYAISFIAADGGTTVTTQNLTITVGEAPRFVRTSSIALAAGRSNNYVISTDPSAYPVPTIEESGALPAGLTFTDNGNGTATIAGTPSGRLGGVFHLSLTASNGIAPAAVQNITMHVDAAPTITSAASSTFTVGSASIFTVTSTGSPTPSFIESGTMPGGVTFIDNGDGTATLSGSPASGTEGSYPLTITASNGVDPDATQSFTLSVDQSPTITSAAATSFSVGTDGTFSVTAAGYPVAALTEVGALPAGVSFVDNGDGTATLSGTPAANTGQIYPITITASNGVSPDGSQSFVLTVDESPDISSATATTFTDGTAGTFLVTASFPSYPLPALSEAGALPAGVTFVDNGNGTATLSGTPAAGTGSTYSLMITASNGVSPDAVQSFILTVDEAPSVLSASSSTFTVGSNGSFTVTTASYPVASLSLSGTLPAGVIFTDNGDGTGTFSGTPSAGSGNPYPVTITASNGVGSDATQSFTLIVDEAPTVSSTAETSFSVGTEGSFEVTASGFPTSTFSASGTLPLGVTFVDNGNGTATIAGTPAASTGGSYPITISASNNIGVAASQGFILSVDQAPTITSANSGTFTVGNATALPIATTGFPSPVVTTSGSLPAGVAIQNTGSGYALDNDAVLGSGGVYTFTISASNGTGSVSQSFTLTEDESPVFSASTSEGEYTFNAGQAVDIPLTVQYAYPAASIELVTSAGPLPSGLSLTGDGTASASLNGTLAVGSGGVYGVEIQASNGIGEPGLALILIQVLEDPGVAIVGSTTFTVGSANTVDLNAIGYPLGDDQPVNNQVLVATAYVDNLPEGLGAKLISTGYSVSGVATAPGQGTVVMTVYGQNAQGQQITKTVTVTITAVEPPGVAAPAVTTGVTENTSTLAPDTAAAGLADTGMRLEGPLLMGLILLMTGITLLVITRPRRRVPLHARTTRS